MVELLEALVFRQREKRTLPEFGVVVTEEVAFEDDETGMDPFFNANRPEDLETARRAMGLISG